MVLLSSVRRSLSKVASNLSIGTLTRYRPKSKLIADPGSAVPPASVYPSLMLRSLSALAMTDTDERLIAAAAIIGDSSVPKTG